MKNCPQCHAQFDDAATECPDHGAVLVQDGPRNNPVLPGSRTVDRSAHTAVASMEELQREAERIHAPDPDPNAESPDPAAATEVPEGRRKKVDRDATRALSPGQIEQMRAERDARNAAMHPSASPQAVEELGLPVRSGRKSSRGGEAHASPPVKGDKGGPKPGKGKDSRENKRRALLLWVGMGALACLAAGTGTYFGFLRKVPVELVTVPPGATVFLDNVERGQSPLTTQVLRGVHAIHARLEGYKEESQIIEVTGRDKAFVITLKKQDAPQAGDPIKDKADALDREARDLLAKGKLDEAEAKWQELGALLPGDPRAADGLAEVARRRAAGTKPVKHARKGGDDDDGPSVAEIARLKPAQRSKLAQKFLEQGKTAYEMGDMSKAKELLSRCVRYNPNHVQCHRWLARVYTREDIVDKTRYHLQRYLELGGTDEDFKVRDWLRSH